MKATKEKEVKKVTPKVTKAIKDPAIKEKAKKEADKIIEKAKQLKAKKEVAEKLSAPIVEIDQPPLPEMPQQKELVLNDRVPASDPFGGTYSTADNSEVVAELFGLDNDEIITNDPGEYLNQSDPNGLTQKKKIGRPKGEPKPPKEPGRRGRPPKLDSEPRVTRPLQMMLYPAEYEQYKQSGLTARQLFMLGLDAHNKIINDAHNLGMETKPVLE